MKNKIKVLQIGAENFGYGGRSVIAYNLALNMNPNLVQNDFLALKYPQKSQYINRINKQGEVIFISPGNSILPLVNEYIKDIKIYQTVRKNKYNIVHIHADNAYEALKSAFLAKIGRITTHIYIHAHSVGSADYSSFKKIIIKVSRMFLPLVSDKCLACTKEVGEYMFGKNSNFDIVEDGIIVNKFLFNPQVRKKFRQEFNVEDKFVIGTVARLSKEKNLDFLISIFNKLCIDYKKTDLELIIVGDGEERKNLITQISKLKIKNKIHLLGNRSDVADLLQMFDLFVLPLLHEGFGMSALEAQVAGLSTVVSTGVSPATRLVNDLYYRIDIHAESKRWESILRKIIVKNVKRRNVKNLIKNKNCDVTTTSKKVQQMYLNSIQEKG